MNLVDTNVWLALALSQHVFHEAAGGWFTGQRGRGSVLFCRATQQSMLRLLTTDKLMRLYDLPAMDNASAWGLYEGLLADARIGWAAEPRGVEAVWKRLAARHTASPKLWMDAYLAAFAIAGGHRLITTDKALVQFREVEVVVIES